MEYEEVSLSAEFLIWLKTEAIVNNRTKSCRVALGNGRAYVMHFVPLCRDSNNNLKLLVAIEGIGSYTFSEGSFSTDYYVKEKLNLGFSCSNKVAEMLNFLLFGRR